MMQLASIVVPISLGIFLLWTVNLLLQRNRARRQIESTESRLQQTLAGVTNGESSSSNYNQQLAHAPSKKRLKPLGAIVAGTHFYDEQFVRTHCHEGTEISLKREPRNKYDSNAIGVYVGFRQIGHLKAALAKRLAPRMDRGDRFQTVIGSMYASPDGQFLRVTLSIAQD